MRSSYAGIITASRLVMARQWSEVAAYAEVDLGELKWIFRRLAGYGYRVEGPNVACSDPTTEWLWHLRVKGCRIRSVKLARLDDSCKWQRINKILKMLIWNTLVTTLQKWFVLYVQYTLNCEENCLTNFTLIYQCTVDMYTLNLTYIVFLRQNYVGLIFTVISGLNY